MAYYGYHQRIRQRIEAGELIGFAFVTDYPKIGKALVLQFSTMPHLRPIRPYRWPEYRDVWGGESMVVQVEIYYEAPKDADKIKNLLESALNRLSEKHKFSCVIVNEKIRIFEGFQRAVIKVLTGSDRVFSLTKDFIYWAFEDFKRKYGFEVPYVIVHVKVDPPGLIKGPGEE